MDRPVPNSQVARSHSFDLIKDRMLQSNKLPLAEGSDSNPWKDSFVTHHERCHPSTAKGANYQSHTPNVWASRPQNGAIHLLKPEAERCHPLNTERCHRLKC